MMADKELVVKRPECIELVVKIPEWIYKRAQEMPSVWCDSVWSGIKNGTPLPKGHGKLIDTSELLTVTDIREDGSEVTYVLYNDIENANTIIEADVPKR
jgi:hypothetical protein